MLDSIARYSYEDERMTTGNIDWDCNGAKQLIKNEVLSFRSEKLIIPLRTKEAFFLSGGVFLGLTCSPMRRAE